MSLVQVGKSILVGSILVGPVREPLLNGIPILLTVFTGATEQYETNSLSHYNCTLVNRNTCNNRHKFYDLVNTFMNSQLNFGHAYSYLNFSAKIWCA